MEIQESQWFHARTLDTPMLQLRLTDALDDILADFVECLNALADARSVNGLLTICCHICNQSKET